MRKSPAGEVKTSGLVLSAQQGYNEDVFPKILEMYAFPGAVVADVTYGRGNFWKKIPKGLYELLATDLKTGVDARELPYEDETLDVVVFDPPYMHSSGGSSHASGASTAMDKYYRNNATKRVSDGHLQVLDLYFTAAVEARRVLRRKGIYVVKCQDEVCANRQRLSHVEIIQNHQDNGWICEDLFVVVRNGTPVVSRMKRQLHARKNHSYFLVFRRSDSGRVWKGPPRPRDAA
jgi:tRNA G10  N-methylase Trm11